MKVRVLVSAAVLGAVVFCWWTASWFKTASLLMPDSCYYMRVARNVSSAKLYLDHRAGVDKYMTAPVYPISIGIASVFANSYEEAGRLVSLLAAMALVLLAFGFGYRAFGPVVGVAAAWLTACIQGEMANLILTESLFALLYMAAAWIIWETCKKTTMLRAVCAGVIVGLATLTRELAFIMIPFGALAMFIAVKNDSGSGLKRRILPGAVFAASAALTITPYWVYSYLVRGTFWGSRFAERAAKDAESISKFSLFLQAVPAGGRVLWNTYPIPITVAVLAGLLLSSKILSREDMNARVFVVGWVLWNFFVLAMLGVTHAQMFGRYLYPVMPLLMLLAGRGAEVFGALLVRPLVHRKPAAAGILKHIVASVCIVVFVVLLAQKALTEAEEQKTPLYQAALYTSGTDKVALDFLAGYDLKPDTYVYDRKPFIAYRLSATWAGLPDVSLDTLAAMAENRPIILVVDSSMIRNFGYPQLVPLLVEKGVPKGWNLLQMHFFPQYSVDGRLMAIYSFGNDYPPGTHLNTDMLSHSELLASAMQWLNRGRFDKAKAYLRAAMQINSNSVDAYILSARIIGIQGAQADRADVVGEALDYAKMALALDPQNPEARQLLCITSDIKSEMDGSKPLCR